MPVTQAPKSRASTLICQHCGSDSFGRGRGLRGLETLIGMLLLLCFIIPGVIYYILKESKAYCNVCGKRV